MEKFEYCPVCGSSHFEKDTQKSKKCSNCGFEYFMNPAAAVVAFITNDKGELLVEKRNNEPAKGTLDLPGGFADVLETAEESIMREVKEETGLTVTEARYLFRLPNVYRYSGLDIQVLCLQGGRRVAAQGHGRCRRVYVDSPRGHPHRAVRPALCAPGPL